MEQARLHEALNRTIYGNGIPLKVFAEALDVSISELSRMLSSENSLRFPHDGVITVMSLAHDYCYLDVMADIAGREVRHKEVSPTEMVRELVKSIEEMPDRIGIVMKPLVEALNK